MKGLPMVLWLALVVVLSGCSAIEMLTAVEDPTPKAIAASAYTMTSVSIRQPDDEPDSDGKCANCNGKGQVGDGRIMKKCRVCNGTGKAVSSAPPEPDAPPEEKVERLLIMHTVPGCTACKIFERDQFPIWFKNGFKLQTVEDGPSVGRLVPWFEIIDGNRKSTAGSQLTWDVYSNWKRQQK